MHLDLGSPFNHWGAAAGGGGGGEGGGNGGGGVAPIRRSDGGTWHRSSWYRVIWWVLIGVGSGTL